MKLPPEVLEHNIEMMNRPPPRPRSVGPWHSQRTHEDDCRCERCYHFSVNAYAPKDRGLCTMRVVEQVDGGAR